MMADIDVENAKNFYIKLMYSKKPVKLTRGDNINFEYFIIPKWAKYKLANEIEKCVIGS